MRYIVLDTETTGLETSQGHRIIEIGCVEVIDRIITGNTYHQYINPEREIDEGAIEIHGISNEFLNDKPKFFDIVSDFMNFIKGSELIIHNARFDIGFINYELSKLKGSKNKVEDSCTVLDTLALARKLHPGLKNNLDALCKRYNVNNSERDLHGALLDAEILADVYLSMTGGQVKLSLDNFSDDLVNQEQSQIRRVDINRSKLRVILPSDRELEEHELKLNNIEKASNGKNLWHNSIISTKDSGEFAKLKPKEIPE
ncbi:MAG: DNA polymerase III subunit epsilon [Thiohalomonadales bacterium]